MTNRQKIRWRRMLKAYYVVQKGGKQTWIAKECGVTRQAVNIDHCWLCSHKEATDWLDTYIEIAECQHKRTFLNDLKSYITLATIVRNIKKRI